jgi:hypothetical protein
MQYDAIPQMSITYPISDEHITLLRCQEIRIFHVLIILKCLYFNICTYANKVGVYM